MWVVRLAQHARSCQLIGFYLKPSFIEQNSSLSREVEGSLHNNKVHIKGKVEQSKERSSALPYTSV